MYYDSFSLLLWLIPLLLLAGAGFAVYGVWSLYQKKRGRGHAAPRRREEAGWHAPEASPGDAGDEDAPGIPDGVDGSAVAADASVSPAPVKARVWDSGKGALSELYARRMKDDTSKQSLFARGCIVAGIALALLIPLALVSDLVDERSALQRNAVNTIAQMWGRSQTVSGPALIVPYEIWRTVAKEVPDGEKGKTRTEYHRENSVAHKVLLPAKLAFDASLEPQTRYYGIYAYVVYSAPVSLRGVFRLPAQSVFDEQLVRVHWEKAWFALGITDLKAIGRVDGMLWNGKSAASFSPNTKAGKLLGPGFHAPVPLDPAKGEQEFSLNVRFNGSGGIYFTPVGETTRIDVKGDWSSPHFGKGLLPESRSITDTRFSASWNIPHISRTYPQIGELGSPDFTIAPSSATKSGEDSGTLSRFSAGVDLYEAVPLYHQVQRAVKYGLLFIGLTFVALLSFELAMRARLHLMQYCLVGVAMALFYLVLLSLAEHSSFFTAFLAASAVSIGMNGLYIGAALRSKSKGAVVMALLAGLYAVLYALLRMEDYALLVGAVLVVVVVGVLMVLTRNLPVTGQAAKEAVDA